MLIFVYMKWVKCFSIITTFMSFLLMSQVQAQTWYAEGSAGMFMNAGEIGQGAKRLYAVQLGASVEFPLIKSKDIFMSGGIKYLYRNESYYLKKNIPQHFYPIEVTNKLHYMYNFVAVPMQIKKYFKVKGVRSFVSLGGNVQYFFTGIIFENYYNIYKLQHEKRIETYYIPSFSNSASFGPMASAGIERGRFQYCFLFINNRYTGVKGSTSTFLFNASYMFKK